MEVYLETERLILRRLTAADADNLVALDSDPAVMRYLNGGVPTPRDVIEGQVLPRFLSYYERYEGFGVWAAVEKSSGAFLGWFSLKPQAVADASAGEVELGYRLQRSAWGMGYATEGARALIRKGFTELGVRHVVATTYQDNLGSRRVMEKAGLRHVRSCRPTLEDLADESGHIPTQEVWDGDEVEYALTRAEWEH